jgi:hypothetical protein
VRASFAAVAASALALSGCAASSGRLANANESSCREGLTAALRDHLAAREPSPGPLAESVVRSLEGEADPETFVVAGSAGRVYFFDVRRRGTGCVLELSNVVESQGDAETPQPVHLVDRSKGATPARSRALPGCVCGR